MDHMTTNSRPGGHSHKGLAAGVLAVLCLVLVLAGCFAFGYKGGLGPSPSIKAPAQTAALAQTAAQEKTPAQPAASSSGTGEIGTQQGGPGLGEGSQGTNLLTAPLQKGTKYRVLIDKSDHKFYLMDGQMVVRAWGCAVGKGGLGQKQVSGDNMTPTGTFLVDEIDDASSWTHDFGDGNGSIAGAYGPWFISLDTRNLSGGNWDGIGIHGTHDPASIGTNASEGCVRLQNDQLEELRQVAYVGMPVTIQD